LQGLGKWAESVKDWDRIIELDEEAIRGPHRVVRAMALAHAGEHTRAAAEAKVLAECPGLSDADRYNLVCAWALCIGPARPDGRQATAQRSALAEEYATRAIALLRRLHASGFFKGPNADLLRTDMDLRLLRDRADFRELLGAGP
jgi:hypothetical protein